MNKGQSKIYDATMLDVLKQSVVFSVAISVYYFASYVYRYHATSDLYRINSVTPKFSFTSQVIIPTVLIFVVGVVGMFLCQSIYLKRIERKSVHLRNELIKVRDVICDGSAKYLRGMRSSGGRLFLSVDALEFYSVKGNFNNENIAILLDDIREVKAMRNRLYIYTDNTVIKFGVYKSKMWENQIAAIL